MSLLLLVLLATAAAPEPDTADTRRRNAQFGQCIVDRRAVAGAEYVLDLETDDAEARKMHRELPLVDCWGRVVGSSGGELQLPADALRYLLADALVRREFSNVVSDFSAVTPLKRARLNEEHFQPKHGKKARASEIEELAANRRGAISAIELAVFGECIARTSPSGSHALLMTSVGSSEEAARFDALATAFGRCRQAGSSLSSRWSDLRGAVALSYYRLAKQPGAEAQVSGEAEAAR